MSRDHTPDPRTNRRTFLKTTGALGVVTLGESITPVLVMGGLLVLVGVVLVQLDVTRETETPG